MSEDLLKRAEKILESIREFNRTELPKLEQMLRELEESHKQFKKKYEEFLAFFKEESK